MERASIPLLIQKLRDTADFMRRAGAADDAYLVDGAASVLYDLMPSADQQIRVEHTDIPSNLRMKRVYENARAEARAAALEEAAKVADDEALYSNQMISSFAPHSAGGSGEREMEIGARSAARNIAKRLRALIEVKA